MKARVVGIDIGTSGVRAVEISGADTDTPVIVHYHEEPLPVGAVKRGEVVETTVVAEALERIWKKGGFTGRDVVLGVGNNRVVARDLNVPSMSIRRIRESLPFQVRDLISMPIENALLDFYPISEIEAEGDVGPQTHGLLIAAAKDMVTANVRAVRSAGLSAVEVDLIPFALSRAILRGTSTDRVIAQIAVGSGSTSVVVTVDGVPQFVRLIPAGGDDITQALRDSLGIDEASAENLKRTVGLSRTVAPEHDAASTVMRNVAADLLDGLRNTLSYFGNSRHDVRVTQILLTGGGARLIGFSEELGALTRLPIVRPTPSAAHLGPEIDTAALQATQGKFLVAYGLALGTRIHAKGTFTRKSLARGAVDTVIGGEPRADLLPDEVKQSRHGRTLRRRLAGVMVGVVIVVLGVMAAVTLELINSTSDLTLAQSDAQLLTADEAKYEELSRVEQSIIQSTTARLEATATEIDWQDYLLQLDELMPAGMTVEGVTVGSVSAGGVDGVESGASASEGVAATIELSVTSASLPQIPDWLEALRTLPGYVAATPGDLTRTETGGYQTSLELQLSDAAFANRFTDGE